MRFFSFKVLILAVILPPLIYIFSVQLTETLLGSRYTSEIRGAYIGNVQPLLHGTIRLKDAINKNISAYLDSKWIYDLGAKINVTVITNSGIILYPPIFEAENSLDLASPPEIAAENYRLMDEGLKIDFDLRIPHNTVLTNLLLAAIVSVTLSGLYLYYRWVAGRSAREQIEKSKEIDRLKRLASTYVSSLKSIEQKRLSLVSELERIKEQQANERNKASLSEEEMITEIVSLEEQIQESSELKARQQREIEHLKEVIKEDEKARSRDDKRKGKLVDTLRKRFNALYKNLVFTDRAISGFNDLSEDLKIKGEEIIHQLNKGSDSISIKRKVFLKKGSNSILEVLFGYKGRLYFRNIQDNKIEILSIGTKNTQKSDLVYLEKFDSGKRFKAI